MQKRTSPLKFAHLAEKSEKGSVPNISTKPPTPASATRTPATTWKALRFPAFSHCENSLVYPLRKADINGEKQHVFSR